MIPHAEDRARIEQIRVVAEATLKPLTVIRDELEVEIVFFEFAADCVRYHVQVWQGYRGARIIPKMEQYLEKRRTTGVAFHHQLLDQSFERQLLMGKGRNRGVARGSKNVPKGRCSRTFAPENQDVDEEAYELFGFKTGTTRNRTTHKDIFLMSVPVQKGLEGCQQSHEKSGAFGLSVLSQRPGQLLRNLKRMMSAGERLEGWSRPVDRQVEHLAAIPESVFPVRQQALKNIALKLLALPQSKIGVLNRQALQRRSVPGYERPIELSEFPEQNTFRPPVKDNVVERQKQNVIVVVDSQEACA